MLVALGEDAGKPSSRWHEAGPDAFLFLEPSALANGTSSTCSGAGPSSHASEVLAVEDILSCSEVEELILNGCGISKSDGDWQQRICTMRQLCQYFDEQDCSETSFQCKGLPSETSLQCKQALRELQHSLSKIALLPPPSASKPSGSARDKLRSLKSAIGAHIGSDILRALIGLSEPKIRSNLLHFGSCILRVEFDALKKREAAAEASIVLGSASRP
jgi:hypothetical protein